MSITDQSVNVAPRAVSPLLQSILPTDFGMQNDLVVGPLPPILLCRIFSVCFELALRLRPFAAVFKGRFPLEVRAAKHLLSYDGWQVTVSTILSANAAHTMGGGSTAWTTKTSTS